MLSSVKVLEKIGDTVILSMNLTDFDEMKEDIEMMENREALNDTYTRSLDSGLSQLVI